NRARQARPRPGRQGGGPVVRGRLDVRARRVVSRGVGGEAWRVPFGHGQAWGHPDPLSWLWRCRARRLWQCRRPGNGNTRGDESILVIARVKRKGARQSLMARTFDATPLRFSASILPS